MLLFLAFSIPRWVGTEQTDNFYFLSFSFFPALFWLKIKPKFDFLIFWIFLLFFCNFLLRVGWERNGTIIFIFMISHPPSTYGGLKWGHNGIFLIFMNLFALFLEFSITRWVGTKRNENIYFLSFSTFSNLFWLQMKPYWLFF